MDSRGQHCKMKGFTFRFTVGVSQRNSEIACALVTNKYLNCAEIQTGKYSKLRFMKNGPNGSTKTKVGVFKSHSRT